MLLPEKDSAGPPHDLLLLLAPADRVFLMYIAQIDSPAQQNLSDAGWLHPHLWEQHLHR